LYLIIIIIIIIIIHCEILGSYSGVDEDSTLLVFGPT